MWGQRRRVGAGAAGQVRLAHIHGQSLWDCSRSHQCVHPLIAQIVPAPRMRCVRSAPPPPHLRKRAEPLLHLRERDALALGQHRARQRRQHVVVVQRHNVKGAVVGAGAEQHLDPEALCTHGAARKRTAPAQGHTSRLAAGTRGGQGWHSTERRSRRSRSGLQLAHGDAEGSRSVQIGTHSTAQALGA